jgi:hypothetical protein
MLTYICAPQNRAIASLHWKAVPKKSVAEHSQDSSHAKNACGVNALGCATGRGKPRPYRGMEGQLKRVTRQRASPQASRKISMAAASAIKAGQLRDMLGARARTASVMKIVVAAMTRR